MTLSSFLHYWLMFHFAAPFVLWVGFLLFFNIWADKTSQNNIQAFNPIQQVLGVIAVVSDFYVDVFWGTFLFLQWPSMQRLMLSTRMDDLIQNGAGYRQWLAVQIVGILLEPFDNTVPKQHKTYGKFKL